MKMPAAIRRALHRQNIPDNEIERIEAKANRLTFQWFFIPLWLGVKPMIRAVRPSRKRGSSHELVIVTTERFKEDHSLDEAIELDEELSLNSQASAFHEWIEYAHGLRSISAADYVVF